MKNLRSFLVLVLFSLATLTVQATDYYFSTTGNDNNTGISESSPFRSLAKASTLFLSPGDRLLFKRGEIFRGELLMFSSGTALNPVSIASYGPGADAVISGSEYINNWEAVGNGIYRAACPVYPQLVFYNGQAQKLARYPNSGFLFTDGANANNGFSDAALPNTGNFYEGAGVHIRTARYLYEERTIAVQVNSYLGFNTPTAANIVAGAGYYLSGKLSFVDTATEYFYDAQSQLLYLKTADGQAPPNNTVEAARYDNGIKLESSANVAISNIKINHQQKNGISIYGAPTSGLTVDNCSFENIYLYAITGSNKANVTISNSRFYDVHCEALYFGGFTNVSINDNIFKRIGMLAGRATDNKIAYKCIDMNGSSGSIRNNILDSIGYNGIQYYQNTLVEKNRVQRFCMTTDDGAGINAYGTTNGIRNGTGCTVRYNIVSDATGNAESYPFRPDPFVNGIGMDDNSGNTTIEYNTIFNVVGRGISIHNSIANQVRNNTVFNCNNGSLVYEHDEFGGMLTGNVTSGNILYNIHENETALKVQNWHYSETGLNFSSFSNNYYINPYYEMPIYTAEYGNTAGGSYGLIQNEYTVRGWRSLKDAGAKETPAKLQQYAVTSYLSNNLVTNGSFDNNISGWECWATNNSCATSWESSSLLDGGSIKLNSPFQYFGFLVNNQPFPLQQGKNYLLSYSVVGDANRINAITVHDRISNAQLTTRAKKEVASTRLDQKLLFTPNASSSAGMLTFYLGDEFIPSYSLDNINVQEVATVAVDPLTQNLFYVNTSHADQTVSLAGNYIDVDGNPVSGSIVLQPFTSKVLIAVSGSTLPLNILEINARPVDDRSSLVQWKLAAANRGCSMELQKSTDGVNFYNIATLAVEDNVFNYHFTDEQFTQSSYYRLKTYCAGEQQRYSKIVLAAKNEGSAGLSIYPNPITDNKLNILNNAGYTSATLFSIDGRKLAQAVLKNGNNVITLPATVTKGVYVVECWGQGLSKTFRVVKK
ncbi:MAG: right-handed parallel beta-helix repeat-containing protein [Ferruginibacter sp.]